MTLLFFMGRMIIGLYFLYNAYSHLVKGTHMIPYAESKGVPRPDITIYASGLLLAFGGFSLLSGIWVTWGITALLAFMIPVTFMMHRFWEETSAAHKMNEKISFLKNVAIIGLLFMLYMIPRPWPISGL